LGRVALALRILRDQLVMPDAVLIDDPPAGQLRELRRVVGGLRPRVELIIGQTSERDPVAALRAAFRLNNHG